MRTRFRSKLILGLVVALLGGLGFVPSAAAAAPEPVVLTGVLSVEAPDEAHPTPVGAAYRVRAVNEDGEVVRQIVTPANYSMTLPGGHTYSVRAEVIDGDVWYPTWYVASRYSGVTSTPVEAEAERLGTSRAGVSIVVSRTAPVSGVITAGSAPGVSSTAFAVDAWREAENGFVKFASTSVKAAPGAAVPWSFNRDTVLPLGNYHFRISERSYPSYNDEYYRELGSFDYNDVTVLGREGRTGIDFTPTAYTWTIGRIAGSDRYDTAVQASYAGDFSWVLPVLYLASGANWPDALSAGPAAGAQGGALLLTDPNVLPTVVAEQINGLQPQRIVVVGSELSVSDTVFRQVQSIIDVPVERIAGVDRYETSRKIVADAFGDGDYETVFLATGTAFPDALSVAPIAGRRNEPVLLVDGAKRELDAPTRAALAALSPEQGQLIGGTPSISAGIAADLRDSGLVDTVDRIAGVDRHDTARKLNDRYPPNELNDLVFVASATGFADALAIGPTAASLGAPLYLSEPTCVPQPTQNAMRGQHLDQVRLLGGPSTLSVAVDTLTRC